MTPQLPEASPPIALRDEHNLKLLGNVHPGEWMNPEPADRYHLVVVGAGTAGLVTAAGAAGLGARVALIERGLMGGDCLNVGCVPSKAVIRAARAWAEARDASNGFGAPRSSGEGDFGRAMERMRELRSGISGNDSAWRFRDLGVDVFLGNGRFVSPRSIEVDGRELHFRRAAITTGARAATPPIRGLAEVGFLTNETLFDVTDLPPRLVVIGGGPIGCEMAQSFARFGSSVTVIDRGDHLLAREDPDAARIVQQALLDDGVRIELGTRVERVEQQGDGSKILIVVKGDQAERLTADRILVAAGRVPNIENLGLEQAGVSHDEHGVAVDDRLRTSNHRIYAAGDVAARYHFTHLADAQARIVIQNALFFGRAKASALVIPWCTYTSPEIAHVGLYARDAEERGIAIDTLTIPLADVDRAILDGSDEGFLRLHLAKGKDRILGATLVAEHAGEMISELTLAMTTGAGLGAIASVIHPYPTQAEVFKRAADRWRRGKLTPRIERIFALYFRLFR